MLAKRLAQRGITLSGGALAAVLSQNVASATMPTSVLSSKAASPEVAALAHGVVKAMWMSKLKAVLAVVLVLGFMASGFVCLQATAQGDRPSIAKKGAKVLQPAPDATSRLEKMLHGTWDGGNLCVGELILNADGTFERHRYSPGSNTLTGTWTVRWDALPPTLRLTCKKSDSSHFVDKTEEFKLLRLDDETLAYQYPEWIDRPPITFTRTKR
jgi:hypothetical protein